MAFKKATKTQSRLRMSITGPSGSGKTYTALRIAKHLAPGGKIAVIDTERGSASKYVGRATPEAFDFDTDEFTPPFSPQKYIDAIKAAEAGGYDVLIIDSFSHAWIGEGGALDMVDNVVKKDRAAGRGGNSFAAFKEVTPLQNKLVQAIVGSTLHVIVTMRAKSEYVMEPDPRTGKMVPRKVGLAPVQRDGLEYEFDVTANIDLENNLAIEKTRCSAITGQVFTKAGPEVAAILSAWLSDGDALAPATTAPASPEPTPEPVKIDKWAVAIEAWKSEVIAKLSTPADVEHARAEFSARFPKVKDTPAFARKLAYELLQAKEREVASATTAHAAPVDEPAPDSEPPGAVTAPTSDDTPAMVASGAPAAEVML